MFQWIQTQFLNLFDTSSFPARWHCGIWTPLHGWMHITGDVLVWGAYMAIPIALTVFLLRRPDIPFPKILWLFGAFIVACGTTHLIEAIIFWHPIYRLSALAKLFTAAISWVTVIALVKAIPEVLRYPGLEALNHKLTQANDDLEDFAKIVSHDLRAPLRGMYRVTEWLEDSIPAEDRQAREHLELLRNRADKMDKMINGILLYSRAGTEACTLKPIDTGGVVKDVMLSLSPEQCQRITLAGNFPIITADDVQLYQVMQNLIENALRYTNKPGGRVTIRAVASDGAYQFVVEDNGPGIAVADAEQIFRMFHTGESSESMHAGLGLAIASKIVERNGGKIWVDSPGESGSRFVFSWPSKPRLVPMQRWATAKA